jgi:dTDP-4-amino-4,6-dideoxygalactose transaminase
MKVPFFDLKRLYRLTEHDIDREVRHVLESGHYVLGPYCAEFEEKLKSELVGQRPGFAIGCNSGTDAIILPLLAIGVGAGDEVISPAHTAIPTIAAIRATGATPVFCDIDPTNWLLDLEQAVVLLTPKTKAIIAVHLYGNMIDIPRLKDLLKKIGRNDVVVIEDVAQAQGSTWNTEQAGTMGQFGSYSFYPTKNIGALGDGGAVFTSSEANADKLKMLRFYGQKTRYDALIERGLNSRLDEIQAAIVSSRMKYLEKWKSKKAEQVSFYRSEFEGLALTMQGVDSSCDPNWHLAVVKFESKAVRDDIQKKLDEKGVQTLIHYPIPTHKQSAFQTFAKRPLPVAEKLAESILSLPMNPVLMKEEVEYVAATLKGLF